MADLLVLLWVSASMAVVVVDAWGGMKRTTSVLPPAMSNVVPTVSAKAGPGRNLKGPGRQKTVRFQL